MIRISLAAAMLVGFTAGAFAQTISVITPSVSTLDLDGVVAQCTIVANSNGSGGTAGLCIGATSSFLEAMKTSDPGVLDQIVTDLVVRLVPLAQEDEACDIVDDEVARAIRLAATYATTSDQALRLNDIAEAIAACAGGATAAIPGTTLGGDGPTGPFGSLVGDPNPGSDT
jgi:hypothetical protein